MRLLLRLRGRRIARVGLGVLSVIIHRAIWWSLERRRAIHAKVGLIGGGVVAVVVGVVVKTGEEMMQTPSESSQSR